MYVVIENIVFSQNKKVMTQRIRKPQLNVELPVELHRRLKIEAMLRDVELKDLVREAVEAFLGSPDDQKRKALKLIQASFNPPTLPMAA